MSQTLADGLGAARSGGQTTGLLLAAALLLGGLGCVYWGLSRQIAQVAEQPVAVADAPLARLEGLVSRVDHLERELNRLLAERAVVALSPVEQAQAAAVVAAPSVPKRRRPRRARLPQGPARPLLVNAFRSIAGDVEACGAGTGGGTLTLRVIIEGATGGVRKAWVVGPFASTSVSRCAERFARELTFPRFGAEQHVASFPYLI